MMNERELDAMRLLAHSLAWAGRFAEASGLLRGILAVSPDDVQARRGLVHSLLRLGEYEEAELLARRLAAEEKGAERIPAIFFHAHSLWGCGRLDECRATVEEYAKTLADAQVRGQA
ncbi:MAG: tetratricopeptide repeat protein [Planctomycetota bacterium]|jgi:thioredoxin-like negative regulator of GroEL|nr:tetratricopeptide repeat protein [Planctomycetota bacterium]